LIGGIGTFFELLHSLKVQLLLSSLTMSAIHLKMQGILIIIVIGLYASLTSAFHFNHIARLSSVSSRRTSNYNDFQRTFLRVNSVLNNILDDDEVYTDFETMNNDNELEKKMARELYDELREGQLGLSIESFLKWEDIEDVMNNGIIDNETMEIIIDEVGVKNGVLSFEQFYELVELVNQVSMALDGDEELLGKST
jgi:hypothetical protein